MTVTEGSELADAAQEALSDDPALDPVKAPWQDLLPGTNLAQVKFQGMAWEGVELPGLREDVEFLVRGVIVGHGEEVMGDGSIRLVGKVRVSSVMIKKD